MPNGKLVAKVRKANDAVYAAKRLYHKALAAAYPLGMHTHYSYGEHWVGCTVIRHCHDDLFVHGDSSGKEYRINGYRFHE